MPAPRSSLKTPDTASAMSDDAMTITDRIRPLIAGHPPEIQSAVLADLLACWVAGHMSRTGSERTQALREAVLEAHMKLVREIVAVYDRFILRVEH